MATYLCSWTPHMYSLSVIQLVKGQAVLLVHLPMEITDAQIDKVVEILLRAFKGSTWDVYRISYIPLITYLCSKVYPLKQ